MDGKTLKYLFTLLKEHLWVLPLMVLLGMTASLAEGFGIGLLIPFLGSFLQDGDISRSAAGPVISLLHSYANLFDKNEQIGFLAASIAALIALKAILVYADGILASWVSGRISHSLRRASFQQILDVVYVYLCGKDNGKLLNTLDEVWRATEAVTTVLRMITRWCMIVVFTTLLLLISWQLTVGAFIAAGLISLLIRPLRAAVRRYGQRAVQANQDLWTRSVQVFDAMRVIRAFGQEPREAQRFAQASENVRRIALRIDIMSGLAQPVLEILYVCVFIGIALLAYAMTLDLSSFLTFLVLFYRLQPHIKGVDQDRVQLAALAGAVQDVFALLDRRDKPYLTTGRVKVDCVRESIKFRDVSFTYGPDEAKRGTLPAVEDVNLEIRSGKVTALVGVSGAGKSTLINLLYRFYDPDSGQITVDQHALPDLDLATWRACMAVAGQDADLVIGTISDNISFGRPEADRASIVEAAVTADAHKFIMELPNGYDTRVGERGYLLSGGQRQRLGLARALLRHPQILILDEATNSLDSLSEAFIQSTLERLQGQMTIIVVAHRLSSIRNASHVYVLNEGRVVESGQPADLVGGNGMFAKLYELQRLSYGQDVDAAFVTTDTQTAAR